jgi:cell division protein FtsB
MELVQTVTNAVVIGAVGLILSFMVHGMRTEVRAEIAQIRAEIAEIRREIADLRSDLTQVALAVGARIRGDRARRADAGE